MVNVVNCKFIYDSSNLFKTWIYNLMVKYSIFNRLYCGSNPHISSYCAKKFKWRFFCIFWQNLKQVFKNITKSYKKVFKNKKLKMWFYVFLNDQYFVKKIHKIMMNKHSWYNHQDKWNSLKNNFNAETTVLIFEKKIQSNLYTFWCF